MLVYSLINYKDHKGRVRGGSPDTAGGGGVDPETTLLSSSQTPSSQSPDTGLEGAMAYGKKMHPAMPEAVSRKEIKVFLSLALGMVTLVIVNRDNLIAA